jgi:tRNA dimethylallyltransferase
MPPIAADCWFLSGPTAAGKTGVGLALAARIGAEIISLDSMAVYRGMDIGTAKPSNEERQRVPHHLVDVIEPSEEFSIAQYLDAAASAIHEIRSRGREVLFVGGTPLYLKALLRGLFEGPAADWPRRRELEDIARQCGSEHLHRQLAQSDPAAAQRLHPNDTRRLVRAIEVFEKTGRPISELQDQFQTGRTAEACRVFVLDWPRDELQRRIDRRVDEMFAAGLVDEVRQLTDPPGVLGKSASQALGYREVLEHLAGQRDLPETVALVKTHTRQFAKRQGTWFRSLSECRLVPVADPLDPDELAGQIASAGATLSIPNRSRPEDLDL